MDLILVSRFRTYSTEKHKHICWMQRHHGRDDVSNHQPYDCLLNRLFRRRLKKTSKLCVTGLWGEFTDDQWIPRTKGQWRGKCFHLMKSSCEFGLESTPYLYRTIHDMYHLETRRSVWSDEFRVFPVVHCSSTETKDDKRIIQCGPLGDDYGISTKGFTLNIVSKWNQTNDIKDVWHMYKELWSFCTDRMVVKRTQFFELYTLHNLEKYKCVVAFYHFCNGITYFVISIMYESRPMRRNRNMARISININLINHFWLAIDWYWRLYNVIR